MLFAALIPALRNLASRRRAILRLALPLLAIYVSLMALHLMFHATLGIVYRTVAGFWGIEFLFLPLILALFVVSLLKTMYAGGRRVDVPNPLRLGGSDKKLFGSVLFLYFLILNLPFLTIGLWGWAGPDHLQAWLGAKGILFTAAAGTAAYLTTEQILHFPALADGRLWSLGQTAQAAEGMKFEMFTALAPVALGGWLLARAPAFVLTPLMPEEGLSVAGRVGYFLAVVPVNGAVALTCAALWCAVAVTFYEKVKKDPRKAVLFDPRNPENIG